MRLIDADAFKEYMRKALEETRGCYPDNGEWAEAVTEQFCEDIDDQPTVEPERKKGEWIEFTNTNHSYVCSVCGRMLVNITDGKNKVTKNYPFCHCGADMRKGEGEKNGQDT